MKYAILKAEGVCVWGGGGLIDSRKQVVGGIELVKNGKLLLVSLFCGMSLIGHLPLICSLSKNRSAKIKNSHFTQNHPFLHLTT